MTNGSERAEESERLSEQFARIARELPHRKLPVHELIERVGQSGMLLFAVFLTLPFLVPVSVPGRTRHRVVVAGWARAGVVAWCSWWILRSVVGADSRRRRMVAR